jgi:hypothetical protein
MENDENLLIENSKSTVLNLETLSVQYNNLLTQYRQAVTDYVAFLNNSSQNQNIVFVSLPGQAFWGSGAQTTTATDLSGCATLCKNTPKCTGATFHSSSTCFLRSGDGNTIPSASDIALIPQEKALQANVHLLDTQLSVLNDRISEIIRANQSLFNLVTSKRHDKSSVLMERHSKLSQERDQIDEMMRTSKSLSEVQSVSGLTTNSNYYSFLLLVAAFILVVVVFVYTLFPSKTAASLVQVGGMNVLAATQASFGEATFGFANAFKEKKWTYVLLALLLFLIFLYYVLF